MDYFRFGPDPAIELNGTVLDADTWALLLRRGIIGIEALSFDPPASYGLREISKTTSIITMEGGQRYTVHRPIGDVLNWFGNSVTPVTSRDALAKAGI
jgi:hypothetical protein